jgi:hypothetical protein
MDAKEREQSGDIEAAKTASSPSPGMAATIAGSAIAGILARVPLHPIDTLKARIQVDVSARKVLQEAASMRGLTSLYRGFPVTAIGSAPATALYFGSYEFGKSWGAVNAPWLPASTVHLAAGFAAETASCVLFVPIDVVKERMQVQRRSTSAAAEAYYTSTFDALSKISRTEGVRGIYKGYGATLASFGPFSALYFMFYEQAS